jgi:hypothetical protein
LSLPSRPRQGRRREAYPADETQCASQARALKRLDDGEALTEIARSYNVSHDTISRLPATGA